jgi:hypothetical protein
MTVNDHLDNNLKKLLSTDQPGLLTMPAAAKARVLHVLTRPPKTSFNWRKIMHHRLVKFTAAAAGLAIACFLLTRAGGVATKAYAMADVPGLFRTARTVHLRTWYNNNPGKITSETWLDLPAGNWWTQSRRDEPGKPGYFDVQCVLAKGLSMEIHFPTKTVEFTRLSPYIRKMYTKMNLEALLQQFFGDPRRMNKYIRVGRETIDGVSYDIWEMEVPALEGGAFKVQTWLAPATGTIAKVFTSTKEKDGKWVPWLGVDVIERDVTPPPGIFNLDPPAGYTLKNTPETAPMEVPFNNICKSSNVTMKATDNKFVMPDGSVIIGWYNEGPSQAEYFKNLSMGGDLPKLPLELYALKPMAGNIGVTYVGCHLAFTRKGGTCYEWGLYVPDKELTVSNVIGYALLCRKNPEGTRLDQKIWGMSNYPVTPSDFDECIRGAMADLSDNEAVPDEITYERVTDLSRQIREASGTGESKNGGS